jgi:hypothetical protein
VQVQMNKIGVCHSPSVIRTRALVPTYLAIGKVKIGIVYQRAIGVTLSQQA